MKRKDPFSLLSNALCSLYAVKRMRRKILSLVTRLEGGQLYSTTLRRIFVAYHDIKIGEYSYGSCFMPQRIPRGTEIGRYCSFAEGVIVFNGNHPLERKSTHPFFYNPVFKYVDKDMVPRTKIKIGNDVWVACNALIMPSVTKIGDGAVVGAGSVVTKDVPPFAVVAGNPAKIIKYRFSEEKIQQILKSPWWDKGIEELKAELPGFLVSVE